MRTMRMCLLLLACLMARPAAAHQDMIFPIDADGAVGRDRIPVKYGPVFLDARFSDDKFNPVSAVTLRFQDREVRLPRCITAVLRSRSIADVEAGGSWYHVGGTLPPYLGLTFFDAGDARHDWLSPGFSLLFDLRDGTLLKFEVLIPRGDNAAQRLPIDIAEQCRQSITP